MLLGAAFLRMLSAERTAALEQMLERSAVAAEMAIRLYVGEEPGRLEGLAASSALDAADWAAFQREARRLLDQHPHWLNIIVTDERQQLFNERFGIEQPLPPVRDLDSVRAVWESGRPAVGNMAPGVNGSARRGVPRPRDPQCDCALHPGCSGCSDTVLPRAARAKATCRMDCSGRRREWYRDRSLGGRGYDGGKVARRTPGGAAAGRREPTGFIRMSDGMDYRIAVAAAISPGWRVAVMAPASLVGAPARFGEYAVWGAVAGVVVLAVVLIGALLSAVTSRRMLDNLSRTSRSSSGGRSGAAAERGTVPHARGIHARTVVRHQLGRREYLHQPALSGILRREGAGSARRQLACRAAP